MMTRSFTRIRTTTLLALAAAGLSALTVATSAQGLNPPPAETGIWIDDTGAGAVEIYVCQDRADRLCGRIVWLKDPLGSEGGPKRDRYNPNASMQQRAICGLPVLGNLASVPEGGFDGGWIYDPKVGKSYSAAIQLSGPDKLVVTGYLAMKLMGKSFTWTRAPAEVARCEGAPPPA